MEWESRPSGDRDPGRTLEKSQGFATIRILPFPTDRCRGCGAQRRSRGAGRIAMRAPYGDDFYAAHRAALAALRTAAR